MVLVSYKLKSAIERGTKPDAWGWKPCHWTNTLKAAVVNARVVYLYPAGNAVASKSGKIRDCSKDTGFIQPVHDGVRRGFVDGLRLGLHTTYPRPSGHGSALASAPGRHSFASCDSAGCPAPPHSRWRVAACRQETSGPFPR